MPAHVTTTAYGVAPDGVAVALHTLHAGPVQVGVATYGAHLTRIALPDRAGAAADVVLGYDTLEDVREPLSGYADTLILTTQDGRELRPEEWPLARTLRGHGQRGRQRGSTNAKAKCFA